MIEGCYIGNVDWERSHLGVKISCPSCNYGNPIQRTYTNLSKNSILLNVHTYKATNICMLTRVMHYWCLPCNEVISGVDRRLLAKRPAHVGAVYPVSPEHGIRKIQAFKLLKMWLTTCEKASKHIQTRNNSQLSYTGDKG
jgi:hypothetical protein